MLQLSKADFVLFIICLYNNNYTMLAILNAEATKNSVKRSKKKTIYQHSVNSAEQ